MDENTQKEIEAAEARREEEEARKEKIMLAEQERRFRDERKRLSRKKRLRGQEPLFSDQEMDKENFDHLSSLTDEELKRQMDQEMSEFKREQNELQLEKLNPDDAEDLKLEKQAAEQFVGQYEEVQNRSGVAKQIGLEQMQEFGEQNEVRLKDLDHDAHQNLGRKWKEGERPRRMQKLAEQVDLRAEVLRNRKDVQDLQRSQGVLNNVQSLARATQDIPFSNKVRNMVEPVEQREKREQAALEAGREEEALKQAQALEEYAVQVQMQVEELERITVGRNMTPEEKKEHNEVLAILEKELVNIENEARNIEQGLSRRELRHHAVDVSQEANELHKNKPAMALKGGKKAYEDAAQILKTESDLLQAMKQQDFSEEEKLSRELAKENQDLEDDSKYLRGQAVAFNFKDTDNKVDAERVARELRRTGDSMKKNSHAIERDEMQRKIRNFKLNINSGENKIKGLKPFVPLSDSVNKVMRDADALNAALGSGDWDDEDKAVAKVHEDIATLDARAAEMEVELAKAGHESEKEAYWQAIKEMRGHADELRKFAEHVRDAAQQKARDEVKRLEEKHHDLLPVLKMSHAQQQAEDNLRFNKKMEPQKL